MDDVSVVWVSTIVPEQLLLARVSVLFDQLDLNPSNLMVAQFHKMAEGYVVRGVPLLSPEECCDHPEPRNLSTAEHLELSRAWVAFTSSDPNEFASYVAHPGPISILHQAMCSLVLRYPHAKSGTSIWDERLLHYTLEAGPKAVRVLGFTLGNADGPDYVGDTYLFQRLMALASPNLQSPLVSVKGSRQSMRDCRVKLTPFGKQVLEGEVNHV